MPPFNIGSTTMGYGLGAASFRRSMSRPASAPFRSWAAVLAQRYSTSGIGNAVERRRRADRRQPLYVGDRRPDLLSSRAINRTRSTRHAITTAVKGMGVEWVRHIDRTHDVGRVRDTLKAALTSKRRRTQGHRRVVGMHAQPAAARTALFAKAAKAGQRLVRQRFGSTRMCTGDHACIRLSGCPSLSVKHTADR